MKNLTLIPLTFLAATASAAVIIGNPTTGIEVVSGSGVDIDSLELFPCRGTSTSTVVVNTVLNQGQSTTVTLPTGSWCDIDLTLSWSPLGAVGTVPVTGFTRLDVVTGGTVQTIELDEPSGSAVLSDD